MFTLVGISFFKCLREKSQRFLHTALEKICSVWTAPYIHQFPSYKLGGILCLLLKDEGAIMPTIGVRTLPLLKSRHKDPPIYTPSDLHRFGS